MKLHLATQVCEMNIHFVKHICCFNFPELNTNITFKMVWEETRLFNDNDNNQKTKACYIMTQKLFFHHGGWWWEIDVFVKTDEHISRKKCFKWHPKWHPESILNGIQNGIWRGISNGVPNGVLNSDPIGDNNGVPHSVKHGVPNGVPNFLTVI